MKRIKVTCCFQQFIFLPVLKNNCCFVPVLSISPDSGPNNWFLNSYLNCYIKYILAVLSSSVLNSLYSLTVWLKSNISLALVFLYVAQSNLSLALVYWYVARWRSSQIRNLKFRSVVFILHPSYFFRYWNGMYHA